MYAILHNEAIILPMLVIIAALASSLLKIIQKAYFTRKKLVFTAKKYEYLYTAVSFILAGGFTFAYEYFYLHINLWAVLIKAGTAALTVSGVYIIIIQVGRKGIKWLWGIVKKYAVKIVTAIKTKNGTTAIGIINDIANDIKEKADTDSEQIDALIDSAEIEDKTIDTIDNVVLLTGASRVVVQKIIAQLKNSNKT